MDKQYDEEYWGRIERNWKQWKEGQIREQRTMETIKEEEKKLSRKVQGPRSGQKKITTKWRMFATHTTNYKNPWDEES